jgi:L-aspartate oxidase
MTARAGVLRTAGGLEACLVTLDEAGGRPAGTVDQDAWETTNLLTVSALLADAALLREETRGSHWREDFPEREDAAQSGHHDWWREADEPCHAFRPSAPTDLAEAAP